MILFVKKEFGILVQLIMQWLGEYAEWLFFRMTRIIRWGCGRFLGPELSNSKTASILHRTQTP